MDVPAAPISPLELSAGREPRSLAPEEVDALYVRDAVRVRRLVRLNVTAPDAVIEDACQTAWMRLVSDPTRVHAAAATGWLVRVAIREAMRGARRSARDRSLEELVEAGGPSAEPAVPAADEVADHRRRLGALDGLPERQRRLVWLRGLGFSYREMAGETGDSMRTVERQLDKARVRLQRLGAV
jgi:RNA polymerase sigma factor (sigma-70 family)